MDGGGEGKQRGGDAGRWMGGREQRGKGKRIEMRQGRGRKRRSAPRYSLYLEASTRLAVFDEGEVKQHNISENNDGMHLCLKFEGK